MMNNEGMDGISKENLQQACERPNGVAFEDYKESGRRNENRKLNKPNPFKMKINKLISNEKNNSEELYRVMKIMFHMCHIDAHKDFLLEHVEDEPNYYRTYNNICKCKARCLIEILDLNPKYVNIKLNNNNKKDYRIWDVVAEIKVGDLMIRTVVDYNRIKDFVSNVGDLELTDISEDGTFLSDRELNKQQYFQLPLKQTLDILDTQVMKLIELKTKNKKNK